MSIYLSLFARNCKFATAFLLIVLLNGLIPNEVFAQQNETKIEEVVVTGSYLARDVDDAASPVSVVGLESLGRQANVTLSDISLTLPINIGSEAQPNIFRQNFNAGTAPLNLRGLGLGSTLVLLSGHRMALSGAYAQDGSSFVDMNSIPTIMIEKLELLKDGAAALYGSDAVAGVANFKMRTRFEGMEIDGSYQETDSGSQDDLGLGFIAGRAFGDTHVVLGFNYMERDPLSTSDRSFTDNTGFSAAGQPGNYVLAAGGPPLPDPACATSGGINGPPPLGLCLFDFIPFAQLVIPEERIQSMLTISHDLSETTALYGEVLVARNEVQGQTLPGSLPSVTGGVPAIAATHPSNPFGADIGLAILRPFGANAPAGVIQRSNDTNRILVGAKGELSAWNWDFSYQFSNNKYRFNFPDVRRSRLAAALLGVGGPGNDEFFNPFGMTSGNSQTVIDDISANQVRNSKSELHTVDLVFVNDALWRLSGGNVGLAAGGQWRHESLDVLYDAESQNFDLAYLVGSNNYDAKRDVFALFAELALPLTETLDVQLAARFEHYEGFGSSVDPKLAVRWQAHNNVVLRGSVSTAFRTPSLHQAFGNQAAVAEFQGPTGSAFRADLTSGNSALDNETALASNIGIVLTPVENFTISLDYWRFDYDDVITKENAETIFNNWVTNGSPCTDTRIIVTDRTFAGPCNPARFIAVNSRFINAASMFTDGLDIALDYSKDTHWGRFGLIANATRIFNLDIQESVSGPKINALGSRNFFNFARTSQKWRANVTAYWEKNGHSANATVRYIDGFLNDQVAIGGTPTTVGSHTTVDLQYSYNFQNWGLTLTGGALNVLDREPPPVNTFLGFESQTHDPRGRIFYVRFKKSFDI